MLSLEKHPAKCRMNLFEIFNSWFVVKTLSKNQLLIILLLFAPILLCTQSIAEKKVVVVVANRITLNDLETPSLTTISKIFSTGAVGLISPNCLGAKDEYACILTAGSGMSSQGSEYLKCIFEPDEVINGKYTAGQEFTVFTGYKPPKGAGVFLGLPQALVDNTDPFRPVSLGALGEAVHNNNGKTCAVGSADLPGNKYYRAAAALAMDSKGIIDIVHFKNAHKLDSESNFGLYSDWESNISEVKECIQKSDFVVMQFGDSVRLDDLRKNMSSIAYNNNKIQILKNLDNTIKELVNNKEVIVVLVSFSPPTKEEGKELTPILISNSDKPGLLISPSTRTPGLIAAGDFAPTIINMLGYAPSIGMVGRKATIQESANAKTDLDELHTRVSAQVVLIKPILLSLAGIGALAFTLSSLIIAFGLNVNKKLINILKTGLLVGVSASLAMLLAPLAPAGVAGYAVATIVAILALVLIAYFVGKYFSSSYSTHLPIILIYALTTVTIIVDAFSGANLCKFSLPSSYQMSGLRYYGVGNEYAGILISMAALFALYTGVYSINKRIKQYISAIIGILVVLALGLGSFGANYGATVAAVVTFGLLGVVLVKGKYKPLHAAVFLVFGFFMIFLFSYLESRAPGDTGSHGAHVTALAGTLGVGYIISLIMRKVFINLAIIISKQSSTILMIFVPFFMLWFYGVNGKINKMNADKPELIQGLKAILVGIATAFLLNDSGFVMACIMLAMLLIVLLYSLLDNKDFWQNRGNEQKEKQNCLE